MTPHGLWILTKVNGIYFLDKDSSNYAQLFVFTNRKIPSLAYGKNIILIKIGRIVFLKLFAILFFSLPCGKKFIK
jgi:hypothetical protein